MSESTNALLFYGVCFDEEDHIWPWRQPPEDEDKPGGLSSEQRADEDETVDEWMARVLPWSDDIEIGEHCCASSPMGYIAIASTSKLAWRGCPVDVSPLFSDGLTDDAQRDWKLEQDRKLRDFCEAVGYDFAALVREKKVGWWLCSWWSA